MAARPLRVSLVTDDAVLATFAPAWAALLARTPMASGFQSLAWITSCRAALPGRRARLFTVIVHDGAEVVGILPTELHRLGVLRFIGERVSNYAGPLYDPDHLPAVMAALSGFLAHERRIRRLDLRGLRSGSPFLDALADAGFPGFATATVVETANCPSLDLTPGWEAIYGRRKGKQRANFSRKWAGLERLGTLAFHEITDAAGARARLPALFALFASRWQGRHESGGFATHHRAFHEQAIPALADAGHLRLSVLELDGRVIAFSYGVWGAPGTSSYVLAHDDRLNVCSPGSLLLLRVLEHACRRGDTEYDFSIGLESYKDQWATGSRAVVRVLRARRRSTAVLAGHLHALGSRAWVAARSIEWLRNLRREGLSAAFGRRPHGGPGNGPGLEAGAGGEWHVHRLRAAAASPKPLVLRPLTFTEMAALFSPSLLELAIDRGFRGDALLALDRDGETLGVVWRAAASRRELVTGGAEVPPELPVYYHPIAGGHEALPHLLEAVAGLDASSELVLVTPGAHDLLDGTVHRFAADHRFATALSD